MKNRKTHKLPRDSYGDRAFPDPPPTDPEELLDYMDDAAKHAGTAGGAGAPDFDHGIRLFNQLKAHYDLQVARELAAAHLGLKRATNVLTAATVWLGVITLLLGAIELWKMLHGR